MQYIASWSRGKDSTYMLEVIKEKGMPLDRIVTAEVMATPTISADLPEMCEWKDYADNEIYKRYGIKVERLRYKESYEEHFYRCFKRGKNKGRIYGFPMVFGNWCNSDLKMPLLKKLHKNNITYIGIACDEPNRFHNLTETKISPLVEHSITEQQCYNWCKENNLLSPIYENSKRGGCWFCHNQSKNQLRLLRKNYPKYWKLMLKWDNDSPVTFKTNGMTIRDFDKLFELEDRQTTLF